MSISRWVTIAGVGSYVIYVGLRGISESWNNDGFPESLAIKLEIMPIIFPVHMVAGGLALLLVPLALYLRGTRWHPVVGRIVAVDVVVAGVTAIPVAMFYPVTKISAAGFATQGIVWITLLGLGIWNIKRGRVAAHQACMLMMAAVTSGALFFRIYLGLWKYFFGFKYFYAFYAVDAWIAWGLPLLATAFWVKYKNLNPDKLQIGKGLPI
jgi:Predicted membrane protein (DUF2306)